MFFQNGANVGGYIEKYLDELRNLVSQRCTFATAGSFIKPCFFKHESSAVGAALYFVDKFITGLQIKILTEITFLPFWEKGVKFFIAQGPNLERLEFAQHIK